MSAALFRLRSPVTGQWLFDFAPVIGSGPRRQFLPVWTADGERAATYCQEEAAELARCVRAEGQRCEVVPA